MDILPAVLDVIPPLTLSAIGSVLTFALAYLALTALRSYIDSRTLPDGRTESATTDRD
jgi:hypothetical protein